MKYAIILPDGAADDPLPQLAGRTPLAVARIPHMQAIARTGRVGRVVTIPPGFTPGTDVATLTLFGYDPARCYSGLAPIEAAARRLTVGPDELVFRCNFVTIADGRMRDFTAGHIRQDEADALVATLNEAVRPAAPGRSQTGSGRGLQTGSTGNSGSAPAGLRGCTFHAGVSYRNLMLADGAAGLDVRTTPPHDIPNEPVSEHLPAGPGQERVRGIMAAAAEIIAGHAVNRARAAAGREPVTGIWLWGQGHPRALEPFAQRFGVRGAVITAVDIIRGLAVQMGMQLIPVAGATGYLDTDYAAKGRAAVAALDEFDLVVVHVEAPDEAAHEGSAEKKIEALERTDEHIVGPVLAKLRTFDRWRILVAPDHVTSTATTQHAAPPPPYCLAGAGVTASDPRPSGFCEAAVADAAPLEPGTTLMESFIRG